MPISPVLEGQTTYPFVRLNEAARRVEARGVDVIDFGTGDPREATDPLIRQALVDGVRERMGYPLAQGLPELREAIADWTRRRFDVVLDPDRQVIPTLGSKEAIFSLAQVVVDLDGGKDTIAYTEPGYPVYERGALFAHARPLALPLLEENGFLPELGALDPLVGPPTLCRLADGEPLEVSGHQRHGMGQMIGAHGQAADGVEVHPGLPDQVEQGGCRHPQIVAPGQSPLAVDEMAAAATGPQLDRFGQDPVAPPLDDLQHLPDHRRTREIVRRRPNPVKAPAMTRAPAMISIHHSAWAARPMPPSTRASSSKTRTSPIPSFFLERSVLPENLFRGSDGAKPFG